MQQFHRIVGPIIDNHYRSKSQKDFQQILFIATSCFVSSHSSGKTIYGQKYQKLDQHSVSGPKTKLLCGFISASLPSKSASFEIYQSYQRIITSYTINVNGVNGDIWIMWNYNKLQKLEDALVKQTPTAPNWFDHKGYHRNHVCHGYQQGWPGKCCLQRWPL